jgi:Ca-activated chloride channel family protein
MTPTRNPFEFPLVWPTFATPPWLLALVVPLLLLVWVWARRWLVPGRRVVLPVDHARGSSGWWAWAFIGLAETIPPLLLAVGVLILAGPQRSGPPRQKRSMTNIQFAVDVSGSMTSPFGEGTRYDASMKAIDAFLDYRKGDSFGLTFFGDAYVHWVPLTADPSAIKCAPPFMRPEVAPPAFGGTAIAKALQGCKKVLQDRDDGDKMVVLISDGDSFDLAQAEQDIVRDFNAVNITVFTIIIGGYDPQDEIVNVCRLTGGEAFRADDPDALPTIFKKIDAMKQAKFTPTFVETIDYFEPFALAGLSLLAVWGLSLFGLRYPPW